jgi:hypothetical protein
MIKCLGFDLVFRKTNCPVVFGFIFFNGYFEIRLFSVEVLLRKKKAIYVVWKSVFYALFRLFFRAVFGWFFEVNLSLFFV